MSRITNIGAQVEVLPADSVSVVTSGAAMVEVTPLPSWGMLTGVAVMVESFAEYPYIGPDVRVLPEKVRHLWLASPEGKTILRNKT